MLCLRPALLALFVWGALAAPLGAQPASGYARAEKALRALAAIPSGQYAFSLTVRTADSLVTRAGTLLFQRKGSDLRLRVEDDEGVWGVEDDRTWRLRADTVYVDSAGAQFRASLAVVQLLNPLLTPNLISAYLLAARPLLVEEKAGCTALEALFAPPRNKVGRARYCFGEAGLPAEVQYTFDDGTELFLALTDYDLAAPARAEHFAPPAGVPVELAPPGE